jgi:hypothetical protein
MNGRELGLPADDRGHGWMILRLRDTGLVGFAIGRADSFEDVA